MRKYHAKTPQRRTRTPKKAVMSIDTWFFLKRLAGGFLVVGCLALIITGIWHATRFSALTITEVAVSGGVTVSHDEIKTMIEEELTGEYLRLVPKRFAWLYPEENIKNRVSNIERVAEVEIERLSGTEISVTFVEYDPFALWCANKNDTDCLFLEENGLAFTTAPNLTGNSFIRYYSLGWEPQIKTQFVSVEDFQTLTVLSEMLKKEFMWPVLRVEVDSVRDAFLTLSGGGELKITLRDDPRQIIGNLQTVVGSKDFDNMQPKDFNYIDLRFGNKVFVHRGVLENDSDIESDLNQNQDQFVREDADEIKPVVAGATTDQEIGISLMSVAIDEEVGEEEEEVNDVLSNDQEEEISE